MDNKKLNKYTLITVVLTRSIHKRLLKNCFW